MQREDAAGMIKRDARCYARPDVRARHSETVVAERRHQLGVQIGRLDLIGTTRLVREAEAGMRRNLDVEGKLAGDE